MEFKSHVGNIANVSLCRCFCHGPLYKATEIKLVKFEFFWGSPKTATLLKNEDGIKGGSRIKIDKNDAGTSSRHPHFLISRLFRGLFCFTILPVRNDANVAVLGDPIFLVPLFQSHPWDAS
jgi:hypothetical protein